MDQQIVQAVQIAVQAATNNSDEELRKQAINYLNEVKDSPDGWQSCLLVFKNAKNTEQTRFFALQVIDAAISRPLSNDQLLLVKDEFLSYLSIDNDLSGSNMPVYMRTKVATIFGSLFIYLFPEYWPSFFDDLFARMQQGGQGEFGNVAAVDMYLRILKVIHDIIGDPLIPRNAEEMQQSNKLKDAIRDSCMGRLVESWKQIIRSYLSSGASNTSLEIIRECLSIVGSWVSWIDITLVVNPDYLELIFGLLGESSLRIAACDTINEIISKKMKPEDKLSLINLLNLTDVVSRLPTATSNKNDNDLEFDEHVAKLTNSVGLELIRIVEASNEVSLQAESVLHKLVPTLFKFLADEYDDTSMQVLPSLSEYLSLIRKDSRQKKSQVSAQEFPKTSRGLYNNFPPDSTFVSNERRQFIAALMPHMITKLRYDDEDDWSGSLDEDESESEFQELRQRIKILQEMVGNIDMDIYIEAISTAIRQSLSSGSRDWRDIEVGLFCLALFSEYLRTNPSNVTSYTAPQQLFYQLFLEMTSSDLITSINHPAIQLQFMEIINKHCSLFTKNEQKTGTAVNMDTHPALQKAIEYCITTCARSDSEKVRYRSWYLLSRIVRSVRQSLGDAALTIYNSLQPVLTIKAVLPSNDSESDLDITFNDPFSHQVYLFELLGLLAADSENQLDVVQRIWQPIYSELEAIVGNSVSNPLVTLQIHHDVMAIGTFCKKFEENPSKIKLETFQEFRNILQCFLVIAQTQDSETIRDAVRFTYARLMPLLKTDMLEELIKLVEVQLQQTQSSKEMCDFLAFIGLIIHAFKGNSTVFNMLSGLLDPMISKLFVMLDRTTTDQDGTDKINEKRELKRAYLQFFFNVFNNGASAVFIESDKTALFQNILQSLLVYTSEFDDSQVQKQAFLSFLKMVQTWKDGRITDGFGAGTEIPWFSSFLFEHISRVCWEFASNPRFSSKDAQCRILLQEIGGLQKTIYEVKGEEFARYLQEQYLPSIGVPSEYAAQYVSSIMQSDLKQFKKFFSEFIIRIAS